MFFLILTDIFNHWFAQGAIPGSISNCVITLLMKVLYDYRLITQLYTRLKILARALANRLQLVNSDLIGPEQNYAVKERSIQDNLHLVRERLKDDTEAALDPLLRWLRDEKASPDRAVFLLLVRFRQRYPRTLMISLSLCPANWT